MLQPGENELFRERQWMIQNTILKVLLPFEAVFTGALLFALVGATKPQDIWKVALVWFGAAIVLPGLIGAMNITTVVTDRRLLVRFFHFPGRTVDLADIRSADPITYNALAEGGWGWRISKSYHRLFNVTGHEGVHVVYGEEQRDQFLLGSMKHEQLAAAIQEASPNL